MFLQDSVSPLAPCRPPMPSSLCDRAKRAVASAIGARLRDVLPLRDDTADFADLLAALELVPGRSIQ